MTIILCMALTVTSYILYKRKVKTLKTQIKILKRKNKILKEGVKLAYRYIEVLEEIAKKYYKIDIDEELGLDEEKDFYDWYWSNYVEIQD